MVTKTFKQAVSSAEFKRIVQFEDTQKTLSSLNYVFYGSMLIASVMFMYWLFLVLGFYLFVAPVAYLVTCYVGRFIELLINTYKNEKDGIQTIGEAHSLDSISEDDNQGQAVQKSVRSSKSKTK